MTLLDTNVVSKFLDRRAQERYPKLVEFVTMTMLLSSTYKNYWTTSAMAVSICEILDVFRAGLLRRLAEHARLL